LFFPPTFRGPPEKKNSLSCAKQLQSTANTTLNTASEIRVFSDLVIRLPRKRAA
jgi:hypothetical protein